MKGMKILDIVHRLSTVLTAVTVTGSCFWWSNSIIVQNGLNCQKDGVYYLGDS